MSSGPCVQPEQCPTAADPNTAVELLRVTERQVLEQVIINLNHELNQPLTAMVNYIQASLRLLERRADNREAEVAGMLHKALNETRRADDIITWLRERVEIGHEIKSSGDLNEVVRTACAMISATAAKDSIETTCELHPELPRVFINRNLILLVLINLLQNSLQALKKSVRRQIIISTSLHGTNSVEIMIQDSGPGVDPKILNKHFFSQPDTRRNGMGIGLTVCQAIIDGHGGRLWVKVNPAGGARFHFTLPAIVKDA